MSWWGSLEIKFFFWNPLLGHDPRTSTDSISDIPRDVSLCTNQLMHWEMVNRRLKTSATEPGNNNWCLAIPSPWCLKWYPSYQERCYWINIRLGRDYLKCKICSFSAAIWIGRYDTAQNCVRRTFGLQYWPRSSSSSLLVTFPFVVLPRRYRNV